MDTTMDRPRLREIDYLIDLLDMPQYRVYDYIRRGKIPHVRIGRRIMVDPLAIERWIAAGGTPGEAA